MTQRGAYANGRNRTKLEASAARKKGAAILDMNRVTGHPAFAHVAVLLAYAALSVAMTWPLAANLRDHVLDAPYFWDAYTNTMLMGARVNAALGKIGVYEGYFFAPITNTIAFNENLFGLSLLFAPFYLVSRNPLLAYNVVLLLSLSLSGYFTYLLVRRLAGSAPAGFLAGAAFAFCPYAVFEIGRIQLVATQWIPLFFLFLHRALHNKRFSDVVGLGVAYALQVGTCLYYAMFMLPIAVLMACLLWLRNRPFSRAFWLRAAGLGAAVVACIGLMVGPYFGTRKRFSLVRSEDFAEDYDGKLSFLLNVHPTNKLLTFLHHMPRSQEGAHEEIAFPTFTIAALALLALLIRLYSGYRARQGRERTRFVLGLPLYTLAVGAAAVAATLLSRSFLAGALVIWAGAIGWRFLAPGGAQPASPLSDWLWALLLTLALFLGLSPLEHDGQVVRGLYYYLHTRVPGFDGIRKVSRQAVILMLCCAVLAGFGIAAILRAIRWPVLRHAVFGLLLCALLLELRNAPMPLVLVPAGRTVSRAYKFIARQPKSDAPIAIAPASWGKPLFSGPRGLAMHNYLALYHGRRTLNGKSSWIPPVTHMVHSALRALPTEAAVRVLQLLRAQYLVLHTGEMSPRLVPEVLGGLAMQPDLVTQVFEQDGDYVFELKDTGDKSLGLLPTPELDPNAFKAVPRSHIHVTASRYRSDAYKMIDDDPDTRWSTQRYQTTGDWVEFSFDTPHEIAALEFRHYKKDVFQAPAAFKLQTSDDGNEFETVFRRQHLRFYADQVHRPTKFVFRVVLPAPVRTHRLRIKLLDGLPGRSWAVHEAVLWTPVSSKDD